MRANQKSPKLILSFIVPRVFFIHYGIIPRVKKMSILQYFQKDNRFRSSNTVFLPDPRGSLSRSIPSSAIVAANAEIRRSMHNRHSTPRRLKRYNIYTLEQRATIGRYAVENSVMAAKRKFSNQLNTDINESTVRRFKRAYLKERHEKRQRQDGGEVRYLHPSKRGRKVLLGEKLDDMVKAFIIHYAYQRKRKCC